jgi:hypothetical protein
MTRESSWTAIAVLPNLQVREAIEGEFMVIASANDERVSTICNCSPSLRELLSRFTSAFATPLTPAILIAKTSVVLSIERTQAFQSFRDIAVASVVPFSRAMNLVYGDQRRISYSDTFWMYPWMLSKDSTHLIGSTPAILGYHVVDQFAGQCSPETPVMDIDRHDLDRPLFASLLTRWKAYYLGNSKSVSDVALFRSLNMANHASKIPSGVDVTLWDFGRIAGLWVSAFEILAHPHISDCTPKDVYRLFNSITYRDERFRRRNLLLYRRNGKGKGQFRLLDLR